MQLITTEAPLTGESAVALGFFDGVHQGHRAVIQAAADWGKQHGQIPCAFTFAADSMPVKQGTALEYLYTDTQKQMLLERCGIRGIYCPPFDMLRGLDGETFCRKVLRELFHARAVFCGGDFRFGAKAACGVNELGQFGQEMGFSVHQIPSVICDGETISSTAIRNAIKQGNMEQAAALLGAPYQICGTVTHGAALGRTQGVPTINMPFAPGQLRPRYGVYVSRVHTPEGVFDGVTDVGVKPTVSNTGTAVAETFLLTFSGDLYDKTCRVELLHFLREERKFPDTDALYRQIANDQADCKTWLHDIARSTAD